MCKEKGLDQYEVSNFAKRGRESLHNLQYWKCRDYIGVGPGAHGRLTFDKNRKGFVQIMQPEQWMEIVSRNDPMTLLGTVKEEQLSIEDRYDEIFLMGLRLTQRGVSEKALLHHTGKNFDSLNQNILKQLLSSGHLDWRITSDDRFLMATEKGIKVLDALLATLLK
jgi:oxygen-independent coproporphyrinogen-3 oxidase